MYKKYFFRWKLLVGIIFVITALVALNINFPSVKGDIEDEIILNFCFQEPVIREVNISNLTYHNVTMNGTYTMGGPGLPMLPVKPLKILLPQKGILESINVTYEDNTSLGDSYNVMLGNNFSEQQNESNESFFNQNVSYPTKLFSKININDFRGYSILMFNLYPVYYIGNNGEIYYYKNMTVTIKTNNEGSISPLFRGLLQDEILMMQKVDDYSMEDTYISYPDPPENSSIVNSDDSYEYMIITVDPFVDASPNPLDSREWFTFQDLANSKNENGTNTAIVTVSEIVNDPRYWNTTNSIFNDTEAQIRNFIIHAYQSWETEYILIGGDNDVVPARYLWFWNKVANPDKDDSLPSDLYYSCLDGSYNAEENYSYWGQPRDGESYTGDVYKPAGGGAFYAEADCEDFPNTSFDVGLFSPSLNFSEIPEIEMFYLEFECNFVANNSGDYFNVSVYSGGKNEENFFQELYFNDSNESRHIKLYLYPESYNDPSDVYISFYYNSNGTNAKSFNIDDVKIWYKNGSFIVEVFWDSFEKAGWAPRDDPNNWTQIKYNGATGGWLQEAYEDDLDLVAEVYVGRACVSDTREVSNFVKKTLAYDNISNNDPSVKKALMVGLKQDEFSYGDACKKEIEDEEYDPYFTQGIPTNLYAVDHLYDSEHKPFGWNKKLLSEKINDGVSIINEVSHGEWNSFLRFLFNIGEHPVFSSILPNSNVSKLSNNKYFFIYSHACLVGKFDQEEDDCLAEYLTVKTPHGAFAAVMNARFGYGGGLGSTDGSSQRYDRQFFDAIFGENIRELGKANQDSKEDNLPYLKQDPSFTMRLCYYELNLFGDPQISIKIPEVNNPPNKPTKPEIYSNFLRWYTFTTSANDPDGDDVQFKFRWRKDEYSEYEYSNWTKWYKSDEIAHVTIRIPYGEHEVSALAKDRCGAESEEWSDPLPITVSFNSYIQTDSTSAVVGEQIQISGQATGGNEPYSTWYYDFGDGNSSEQQNTIHIYITLGNFTITLTVTDAQNISSNTTKVINVVLLKSDFESSSVYSTPDETIFFNDTSGGYYNIINWLWDFGDGNISYDQNTSHVYSAEGAYNVSLTVTDNESNTNVFYQTIFIDSTSPEITCDPNNLVDVEYGSYAILTANITDNISDIKIVRVNITYPDSTYGNFTMNKTNDSKYEYVFPDTWNLGVYNYTIWVVDNAENTICLQGNSFNVSRYFGCNKIGSLNQTVWDVITGSVFTVNKNSAAENISVYIDPGNATSESHYQCLIYQHNDSELIGVTEEKNILGGKGWQTFNFSDPKPVLMNNSEYVLCCWADNDTVKMYYNINNEEEWFYDDGSSTLQGHYFEGLYNCTPDSINFDHEDRKYSIYCSYSSDENPPILTNISNTQGTAGFGFDINITADIVDNESGLNSSRVYITYPDNSTDFFDLGNINGSNYQYVFSDTWKTGQYTYYIWVIDNSSNSNTSSQYSFNVSAQANISIATLKDSYGNSEPIEITDPPNPPENYMLVDRGLTWNKYYDAISGSNVLEAYTSPVNYQEDNGIWTPINCSLKQLQADHPAYNYGYRVGNEQGLYNVYFKSNVQSNWPLAFAYNKSDDPSVHVVRSKLVGVGYLDPASDWAYEYLQNAQSSQGQFTGNKATFENVFLGTDVVWSYDNMELKEKITLSNTTKTLLQNHPPSLYGLQNESSYLVFITKLDYQNLILHNESGTLNGNVTISDGWISFKDILGYLKCALPIGDAYELYNESVRHKLVYRVLQYNGNYYLLSGLKVQDLNNMVFPVVIDPTLTVYASQSDGYIYKSSSNYNNAWSAEEGTVYDSNSYISIGQSKVATFPPNYRIRRGFLIFNTSELPSNAYIDNATLSLYKNADYSNTDFTITVQNGQPDYPHDPLEERDYNKEYYAGSGGGLNTINFVSGNNNIALTELSWINAGGVTKLCLRSSRDINGTTPTDNEYVNVYSANAPDVPEGYLPKLIIEYRNQSKIKNTGSTNITGYLLMQVQYLEDKWVVDHNTVDEASPRTISVGNQLALDEIFNGLVITDDLYHGSGTYRVYAAFRDPDGDVLVCDDDSLLEAWYEFTVVFE